MLVVLLLLGTITGAALGALVFGPGAEGARLEGSKAHMKQLVAAAGVPTARFAVFDAPAFSISTEKKPDTELANGPAAPPP